MKKNKFNIFCAWMLLICFAAGQYIVCVHQHNVLKKSLTSFESVKNHIPPVNTVQEKCYLCDVMHHNAMTIDHQTYFSPVVVCGHIYKAGYYNFISIALVLAAGRAPPVVAFC
ncbi:MAG: hypothetical protein ACXVAY_09850 [Mucilaginibacter sp.]